MLMTDRRMTVQTKHQQMRLLNGQVCTYSAKDGRPSPTHDHFILTTLKKSLVHKSENGSTLADEFPLTHMDLKNLAECPHGKTMIHLYGWYWIQTVGTRFRMTCSTELVKWSNRWKFPTNIPQKNNNNKNSYLIKTTSHLKINKSKTHYKYCR